MASNPIEKILRPRFHACAVGFEKDAIAVVQLERGRGGFVVKRAASLTLPPDVVRPGFDESNVSDPTDLATALSDLLTSAGLLRQRKWSVTLPEASTRSAVLALEGTPGSRRELEEVLEWKIERTFGAPLSEMRVNREQLPANDQSQVRYLATAVRLSVLEEFESVFRALGWQAGLVLPRHAGEEQWLRHGSQGDGLLLTAHDEGFTAGFVRGGRRRAPRSVFGAPAEGRQGVRRGVRFFRRTPLGN